MKPLIVAELSANHLGSLDRALRIIDAAKWAGADAVKFQTFQVKSLAPDPDRVIDSGPWAGRRAGELYSQAQTPRKWHEALFNYARAIQIEPFSSVFSPDDVDFLEELNCPRYKIASFELVDLDLIHSAAKTGKPVILSVGMATMADIYDAVCMAHGGSPDVTVLKCTSAYPTPVSEANLATMVHLRQTFEEMGTKTKVGLSDHTLGIAVPVAATALGAVMIEKHLTLKRADGGPDAAFSLEPNEFKGMVQACRDAAAAIGEVRYQPTESEKPQLQFRGRTVRARATVA
jgi:sialic acid synthase SpsE